MYTTQSVVFHRGSTTLKEAIDFLKRHKMKHDKLDITANTFRARQEDPDALEKKGYRFRMKAFPMGYFVIAYKD